MFTRNVCLRLKPNTLTEFARSYATDVLPAMGKQLGFRGAITTATEGGVEVTISSLWDTREQAEAYDTAAHPGMKSLEHVLDGTPEVRVLAVVASTFHQLSAAGVAA